jgi:uncharacterized protein YheU (UPF0270 family)
MSHNADQNSANSIIIPFRDLKPETLEQLIQEFVTRDGCDWDQPDCSLEDKVRQVMQQLHRGHIQIVFDLISETANLISTT